MKSLLGWWRLWAEAVGVLLFVAMFVGFGAQVISRYVFNRPVIWSNDLILMAFLWWFTWAAAFLVDLREHVAFASPFSGKRGRWVRTLAAILAAVLFAWTLPGSLDYLRFMLKQTTGALDLPVGYFFLGFAFFNLAMPIRLLLSLGRLGGSPLGEHSE